jgi:hypothetical protein
MKFLAAFTEAALQVLEAAIKIIILVFAYFIGAITLLALIIGIVILCILFLVVSASYGITLVLENFSTFKFIRDGRESIFGMEIVWIYYEPLDLDLPFFKTFFTMENKYNSVCTGLVIGKEYKSLSLNSNDNLYSSKNEKNSSFDFDAFVIGIGTALVWGIIANLLVIAIHSLDTRMWVIFLAMSLTFYATLLFLGLVSLQNRGYSFKSFFLGVAIGALIVGIGDLISGVGMKFDKLFSTGWKTSLTFMLIFAFLLLIGFMLNMPGIEILTLIGEILLIFDTLGEFIGSILLLMELHRRHRKQAKKDNIAWCVVTIGIVSIIAGLIFLFLYFNI